MKTIEIIIVALIVGASAFWAISRIRKSFSKKEDDCATCKGCPLSEGCKSDKKTL